jgi:hypothetical protein
MEKEELESAVKIVKAWRDASAHGDLEALKSLSSFLANIALQFLSGFTNSTHIIERLWLPPSYTSRHSITSDSFRVLRDSTRRMTHVPTFTFGEVNPEREQRVHVSVYCWSESASEYQPLEPKDILLENNPSVNKEPAEEERIAQLIQATLKRVEGIRLEMKRDEEEIAQIQIATQNLLEKIKVA